MLIKIKSKKATAANWLLGVFTLLLMLGATFSHFFQAPINEQHDLSKFTSLFSDTKLKAINKIVLHNQIGNYSLVKKQEAHGNDWVLISPRKLNAKEQSVELLIDTLRKIKIKKIFNKDPINLSNFSLNRPLITIDISYDHSDANDSLLIGLSNPIDNSTYVTFKNKDAIFQVDTMTSPIETYDLGLFINSNVFPRFDNSISQIEIYREKRVGTPTLTISKKENIWFAKQEKELNQERVQEFIEKLSTLKSQIILDVVNEEQEKKISRYLEKPLFTIVITKNGVEISYIVTHLIDKLPDIKNEKWQSFIIAGDNNSHPMIVSKDAVKIFSIRSSGLGKLQLKKLFY